MKPWKSKVKLLIHHKRSEIISFCQKVIRRKKLTKVFFRKDWKSCKLKLIKASSVLPDTILRNVLALINRQVIYNFQHMLTLRTNDNLFVTVTNKRIKTDSKCHQLTGTLCKTMSLLKDELRDKQVMANNLIDVLKNFTVNGNKYTRNKCMQ